VIAAAEDEESSTSDISRNLRKTLSNCTRTGDIKRGTISITTAGKILGAASLGGQQPHLHPNPLATQSVEFIAQKSTTSIPESSNIGILHRSNACYILLSALSIRRQRSRNRRHKARNSTAGNSTASHELAQPVYQSIVRIGSCHQGNEWA